MAEAISVSGAVTGTNKSLAFETGKLAPQSQGAVVARIGGTTVLATANASKGVREGIDFFPLTVDVEERMYAAGKIPGSFFRREGRPSDLAILNARLIDRPLRPSFPDGYRNETQVVITVLGADHGEPAGRARHQRGERRARCCRASRSTGRSARCASRTHKTVVGSRTRPTTKVTSRRSSSSSPAVRSSSGDIAIMMVEAGGTEKASEYYDNGAPKVTEEVIAAGLEECKQWIRESIEMQRQLVEKAGARPPLEYTPMLDYTPEIAEKVAALGTDRLAQAQTIADKTERALATDEATNFVLQELTAEGAAFEGRVGEVKAAVRSLTKKVVRKRIVEEGLRIDGRTPTDIRPLSAEVHVLPTAHGSGLFQRGETQVLDVCTLGMPKMDQLLDTLAPENHKRYMHHYNMPPHANGEVGRVGSPKRREIGHGLLAERALLPVVPSKESFPYTLRLVSEVLSSNGSTSMGSVCASSLSLMDAGVPVRAHVGGIAMGLVYEEGKYITLTDILGAEDAFGDMDFKVAGTSEFVTALQLDTKIDGLPADVLAQALQQAREARLQILEVMTKTIAEPRSEVGETAPKIISFEIPMDKIGEVIGPKGKVINAIQLETGADISVDDDGSVGTVTIGSVDGGAVEEAKRQIQLILNPPTAGVGEVYNGRVVNITKFGAFINILPGRDGLLHISKMGGGKRIDRVEDVLDLGDEVEVRVDDVDPNGKVSLSPVTPLAGDGSGGSGGSGGSDEGSSRSGGNGGERSRPASSGREEVSFEDSFDAELRQEFGDLGPAEVTSDRGDRGGDRGGRSGSRSPRGGRGRGGDRRR